MTKLSDDEFQKIVTDIMYINRKYSDGEHLKSLPGDVLSYTGTKLAAMKALLIETKVDAHKEFLDAETEYKRTKAEAIRRLVGQPIKEGGAKISQSAAPDLMYAEEDVIKAGKRKNDAEAFWNQLKNLTSDSHDLIDSIKSRVIDLQGARRDER